MYIAVDAIRFGMFTIIAYMGGLFLILLLSGRKVSLLNKLSLLIFGILFVSFLQLFKLGLRKSTGDVQVADIASSVVSKAQTTQFETTLFPLYYRMNQGFNIALVIQRIPARVDYLGGEYLALTFASAFVPRLFWADKPEAAELTT